MLRFIAAIVFIYGVSFGLADAQDGIVDAEFGVIPDSLFGMVAPSNSPEFPYMVTNKEADISFRESEGNIIAVLKHHVRLKVFDASARGASLVTIPYYFQDNMEQISDIRGQTYLPSGKRIELNPDNIKTINLNSRYNVKEFSLPNVEDGAVLEYSYVIRRRYIEELPDFYLAQKVPTAHAKVTITYPPYLRFSSVIGNYSGTVKHDFVYTDTSSVPKIFTIPQPPPVVTERWSASHIPAVQKESFITTLDDYRGKIKFILSAFGLPRQPLDTSWEVVVAKMRRNTNPLTQISQYRYARAVGDSLARQYPDIGRKALQDTVYRYLNKRANFSDSYAPYSTESDTAVLAGKAVDQAAINQTLIAMLRGAGIEAHPVLTSTRSAGKINRRFPSYYQLNALAVQSRVAGKQFLMDASLAHSQPNLLPVQMNNGRGLLVLGDSFSWISMQVPQSSFDIRVQVKGKLHPNGTLSGEIAARQTGYPAQLIRQRKVEGTSDADILRQTLLDRYPRLKVEDVRIEGLHSYNQPVTLRARFQIESYAISYTDGLRFRPMLVGQQMNNPFEDTSRDLPITLPAPEHLQVSYSIELPEGYQMETGTESKTMRLPGARFEESYEIQPKVLNYNFAIDINRQNFPTRLFDPLYNLYERWVELSNTSWMIGR